MKRRSPAAPLLLPFVTFGIYSIVWFVKTKNELNATGAKIPTAWMLIVPIANFVWYWRFAVGVEEYTNKGLSRAGTFWLLALLNLIGAAIVQNALNAANTGSSAVTATAVPAAA